MICSIEEAYNILGLDDPIQFQQTKLAKYVENIREGKHSNASEDIILKEAFLYMRQTGKTTYKAVDAAVRLISGRDVMFLATNISQRKMVEKKIRNYVWQLGHKYQRDYTDVGSLEVRAANNIERIKLETRGYGGDIIIDIY